MTSIESPQHVDVVSATEIPQGQKPAITFTQEQLVAAYQQIVAERTAEKDAADAVAAHLSAETGFKFEVPMIDSRSGDQKMMTPDRHVHSLVMRLTEHDDWAGALRILAQHGVHMRPWSGNLSHEPTGTYAPPADLHPAAQESYSLIIKELLLVDC